MAAEFYERNPQARDLGNKPSPSRLLDGKSREWILRNAFSRMQNMRRYRGSSLWSWIGDVTGYGSGYSWQVCIEMGWDPDMRITPNAKLPRREDSAGEKS
jgi:hypothetical protein